MTAFPTLPPSGGTAITAAVLALLGALWAIVMLVQGIGILANDPALPVWTLWQQGIASVIELSTLGVGSILLFLRKHIGRALVVTGCAVHLLQGIVPFGGFWTIGHVSLFVLIPAIATLILVLLPHTARWCDWGRGRQPAPAVPYGVVPPGGMPPPGMPPGGMQQPPQW
jgi:hypothetical protein